MVSAQLAKFCETTSVKGVTRTVKSPSRALRINWAIVVIISIVLAVWQSAVLMMEYWTYPAVTVVKEFAFAENDEPPPDYIPTVFPSVTVCNSNSYSSDPALYTDYMTHVQYDQLLKDVIDKYKGDRLKGSVHEYLLANGYQDYLGPQGLLQVGHNENDFIVECHWHVYDGYIKNNLSCSDHGNITPVIMGDMQKCFTITPIEKVVRGHALDIEVILYLDDEEFHPSKDYKQTKSTEYGTGAFLMIHKDDLMPNHYQKISLPAGQATAINYELTTKIRLPPPHGKCQETLNTPLLYTVTGQQLNYSTLACWEACVKQPVIESCGCMSHSTLATFSNNTISLPYCGKLHDDDLETTLSNLECMTNSTDTSSCKVCSSECIEHMPNIAISSTRWPDINHELAFYNTYIIGSRFQPRFTDTYQPILNMWNTYHKSNSSQLKHEIHSALKETSMIEDNFLKVKVRWAQHDYQIFADEPKFTVTGLLAQLGATLNLYAGITFILVFEVVELMYNILYVAVQSRTEPPGET